MKTIKITILLCALIAIFTSPVFGLVLTYTNTLTDLTTGFAWDMPVVPEMQSILGNQLRINIEVPSAETLSDLPDYSDDLPRTNWKAVYVREWVPVNPVLIAFTQGPVAFTSITRPILLHVSDDGNQIMGWDLQADGVATITSSYFNSLSYVYFGLQSTFDYRGLHEFSNIIEDPLSTDRNNPYMYFWNTVPGTWTIDYTPSEGPTVHWVPEPSMMILFLIGLLTITLFKRREHEV